MQPKPKFFDNQGRDSFRGTEVASAYQHRPSYPDETFIILKKLIIDSPSRLLDVGCGNGFIARPISKHVDHVDAIDISNGKRQNLKWILGSVENAQLNGHYSLITAGDCLHWMDWKVVFPRFASLLAPGRHLAILDIEFTPPPWNDKLWSIWKQFAVIPGWKSYNIADGLEERGLFKVNGVSRTAPANYKQTLNEYIASFHGRALFDPKRMGKENARKFDQMVKKLVAPYCQDDGKLELNRVARVIWGTPLNIDEIKL